MKNLRLGVNIDHVATIRNQRGDLHPDPVFAAKLAHKAGADGITAHLREDRRHIKDHDMFRLQEEVDLPLNFEMAATEEMQKIALEVMPNAVCLVPEKREELTTEAGLNLIKFQERIKEFIIPLKKAGIKISIFLDPNREQIEAAYNIGVDAIELHTGDYAKKLPNANYELNKIFESARYISLLGLECHAGHGLNFENVLEIASIDYIEELNIGHFLIGESIFCGLESTIWKMKQLMEKARLKEMKYCS